MDRALSLRADGAAKVGFAVRWLGMLGLLALFAWQTWLTLGLFGPDRPWERLLDDEPIVSGAHPLHLYFGYLGARAFYDHGTLCGYDPSFQAGYPKTPVFDNGSRPAELFLSLAGAAYRPAAYKLGLAVCCCLVPVLFAISGRCLGLGPIGALACAAAGLLVWWGVPCRQALEAGDLDLLMAGLATLTFMALLLRFDRRPDVGGWLGLVVAGWAACFMQPFVFALALPLHLIYYLSIGARHRLSWHLALVGSLAVGLAANAFWLIDWVTSWWIRKPLQLVGEPLLHRTFHTIWDAPLWGGVADRSLAVGLTALAFVGVFILNQNGQRVAARVLGLGAGGALVLAVVGLTWRPLGPLGTSQLLVPALCFAVLPAIYGMAQIYLWAGARMGRRWCGALAVTGVLLGLAACGPELVLALAPRCWRSCPLAIGLGEERRALIDTLREHTTAGGRILLEDRPARAEAPRWTALLPQLSDRVFLGGLDPDGWIEHSFARLVDGNLAGRPIADYSDAELEAFCRRYNVGWALCWSPAAVARFRAWSGTRAELIVADNGPGLLFTLKPQSYVLKGHADVWCVNRQQIQLANVTPDEDGVVVLSQHYQAGMQASPGRVQIERDRDLYALDDPIPFIRLRLPPGPVPLVTLTWDDH